MGDAALMLKKAPQKPRSRASAKKTIEEELAVPANWEERLAIARAKREKVLAAKAKASQHIPKAKAKPSSRPQKPTISLAKAQQLRDQTPQSDNVVAVAALVSSKKPTQRNIAPVEKETKKQDFQVPTIVVPAKPPSPKEEPRKKKAGFAFIALACCVGLGIGIALGVGLSGAFLSPNSPLPSDNRLAEIPPSDPEANPNVASLSEGLISNPEIIAVEETVQNIPEPGPELLITLEQSQIEYLSATVTDSALVEIPDSAFGSPRVQSSISEPSELLRPFDIGFDSVARLPSGWTSAPRLAQLGLPSETSNSGLLSFQAVARPTNSVDLIASLSPDALTSLALGSETAGTVLVSTDVPLWPAAPNSLPFEQVVFTSTPTESLSAGPKVSLIAALLPDAAPLQPESLAPVPAVVIGLPQPTELPVETYTSNLIAGFSGAGNLPARAAEPETLEVASLKFALPLVEPAPDAPTDLNFAASIGLTRQQAEKFNLYLFAPGSVSDPNLAEYQSTLLETGLSLDTTRRVSFKISKTQIRYYNSSDATVAKKLASELGIIARDFTSSGGDLGRIEIWMQGTSAKKPVAVARKSKPKPPRVDARTQLTNSIISGLRTNK